MLEDIKIKKDIKILFMGTPGFAVPILEGLIKNYNVKAVITQPDKKVGREGLVRETPIKKLAKENTILVLQPEKIRDFIDDVRQLDVDLIVTCAYGQLVPRQILNAAPLGAINVHASLLPRHRGGAPIHRAILKGGSKTGITIMNMDEGLDTGDILSSKEIAIDVLDTASSLHDKLSLLGKELLLDTLPNIIDGTITPIKQDDFLATYAPNISREDEKIDFRNNKRQVYNHIRGLNSWPGAYCVLGDTVIKVWDSYLTDNYFNDKLEGEITDVYSDGFGVKVSNGEIVFKTIQPEGKPKMNAGDFARGYENKGGLKGKILA